MNKKNIIPIISIIGVCCITIIVILILQGNNNTSSTNTTASTNLSYESKENDVNWDSLNSTSITNEDTLNITEEGVYTLTGNITGGVVIDTAGAVKLILSNANISNDSGSAIYVKNAEIVYIYLEDGTTNYITDSSSYTIDYGSEEVNGAIYSKDDLVFDGTGTLNVTGSYEDAIVSKDSIKFVNGTYNITSSDDGIRGKDYVVISNGTFNINAKGDGIKSTNDTDEILGYVLVENGNITITSVNDGIQAETKLIVKNGNITIKTTGNADSDSAKGLKAGSLVEIDGGTLSINTTDDGIHSNGNITINNGDITITSGDDGIHADALVEVNDGSISISAHEGIEATYVKINGGTINISASDDGINAGKKSDAYSVTIEINGGNITIKMGSGDTDAIDSNGNLYINGGTLNITASSPFDYDGEAKYTGGTMIVNGEQTTTITNQFMGGPNGGNMKGGMQQGNMQGEPNDRIQQGNMQRGGKR